MYIYIYLHIYIYIYHSQWILKEVDPSNLFFWWINSESPTTPTIQLKPLEGWGNVEGLRQQMANYGDGTVNKKLKQDGNECFHIV